MISEFKKGTSMNDNLFQELVDSVREGGKILKCESEPARTFYVRETDVLAIRKRYGMTEPKFPALLGVKEIEKL